MECPHGAARSPRDPERAARYAAHPRPGLAPPLSTFFAVSRLFGAPDSVLYAVEQIARATDAVLQLDALVELPPDAWESLPPQLLNPVQQAIVREDLRHAKRRLIAQKLHISPNTVTAYRTIIRKKLLRLPTQGRPVWMLVWLRRFPGTGGKGFRGA
ncbi:MAG TPA: hypothetical protein VFS21_34175 [Roseiflexaceae bacterium]|nr:hypothetical protein [Roseiflexaceae bacterium]